jgi:chromosome segregation ATPase
LFFLLGFLCAGLLALMFAPALWRRAVNLTRRRIESSIPLTLSEIQADKDAMRADFAMATRRLEMKLKSANERAAGQAVEIGVKMEEIKSLTRDRDEKTATIARLEDRVTQLEDQLRQSEAETARLADRLEAARGSIQQQVEEIQKIGQLHDEASFAASTRQIELVARESEIEKLSNDLSVARGQRKDFEAKLRETANENRQIRASYETERKKTADLERRMARMMSVLSDREEKLERRDKQVAELRGKVRGLSGAEAPGSQGDGDAALREQIHQLAAEVVAMSARLEEPGSPLGEVLSAAGATEEALNGQDRPPSLAERIRALRHQDEPAAPPPSTRAAP